MKKFISLITFCLLFTINSFAQFNGEIYYKLEIESESAQIGMVKSMLPNGFYLYKNEDLLKLSLDGGGMLLGSAPSEVIFNTKDNTMHAINHTNKTVMKLEMKEGVPEDKVNEAKENFSDKVKMTKVGKEKIADVKCKKFQVEINDDDIEENVEELSIFVWTSKKAKMKMPSATGSIADLLTFFQSEMNGFPLKLEITFNVQGESGTLILSANKVEKGDLPADTFELPKGYTVDEKK